MMVGKLDREVIEKFKEFQNTEKGKKYRNLNIEEVLFDNKSIGDVVLNFIKGSTPKYSTEKADIIVIKSGQARGNYNKFDLTKIAYLDKTKVKNPKFLQKGDILINTTGIGTAGRVTLFDLDGKYVSDSHITALRYDQTKYNKFYLLYFFINIGFKKLEELAEGTGGQIELSMDRIKPLKIPIPKSLDDKEYTSYKIQEAIVEFLEYSFNRIDRIRENIDIKYNLYKRLKKALIPSTFIKDYVKVAFSRYAKEHDINFDITDVEFKDIEIDKLVDSLGGSSKYNRAYIKNNKGDYPLYTGSKEIIGYVKPIKKTDVINKESVSYNKDNDAGSIAFYHNEPYIIGGHHYALFIKKEYSSEILIKYFYYCMQNIFIQNKFYQSKQPVANIGKIKQFKISIPKPLKGYNSLEIQKIIADFIEFHEKRIQKEFDAMDRAYEITEKLRKVYLGRTFSLIDWRDR